MSDSTILFISYALHGHANPSLALARELADRGHRVQFAIPREGAGWLDHPAIEKIDWEPSGPDGERLTQFQRRVRGKASEQASWHHGQYLVTQSMTRTHKLVYETVRPLLQKLRPAVVVTPQTLPPAMDAAVDANIPLAIQSFFLPPSVRQKSPGRAFEPPICSSWLRRVEDCYYALRLQAAWYLHDRVRRRCSPCNSYGNLFRQHTVISSTAACIEPSCEFDSNVHMCGPIIAPPKPLPLDLLRWLDESRDEGVVFVALGTLVSLRPERIAALSDGLQRCRRRVLWALPEGQQRMLGHLPDSMRVENFVDQCGVLEHPAVRCFVNHAGANSFMESMLCGKPMLACPIMLDQPFFASRVSALGVGTVLNGHDITAEVIHGGLDKLLSNESFSRNALQVSRTLHQSGGVTSAAKVIEQVLKQEPVRASAA